MPPDLDLGDLDEVRRRVVEPVLARLFRPGEVVSAELTLGDPPGFSRQADAGAEIWLRLVDRDHDVVYEHLGAAAGHPVNAEDVVWHLVDNILEWLSETGYAWGEQRFMHGPFPGPLTSGPDTR